MILYLGNKLTVHGYSPTGVETLGNRIPELGYVVISKSSVLNKVLRLIDMLSAVMKYRKHNPIVLIDTYSKSAFWYAYAIAAFCSIFKLKFIPILRGGELPLRIEQSPFLSNMIFRKSHINVAVSKYLYEYFRLKNYPVVKIHNFIEIENYPVTVRRNIQPRLLWVRSFHNIYNPVMALMVLKELKKDFPQSTLCMVGPEKDGSLEVCKRLSAELNLDVTFTGLLNKADWIELSKNYDIFINTTNIDNAPVSVMEAMALGMNVISTRVGGIQYLFTDGEEGVMVEVGNVQEMTNAIKLLIADPAKAEALSCAARTRAEKWDWQEIGSQWKKLFESITKV